MCDVSQVGVGMLEAYDQALAARSAAVYQATAQVCACSGMLA